MTTGNNENVFSLPWDGSDIILVVEDQELHVHKWILISQSPVFKAMLDGHFKEASQDKVTLEGKDFGSMIHFLKMLYPVSMFEVKAPLDDKNRMSTLALAEEYQCINLIKLCLNEIKMTPENVMEILPYVVKYHQAVLPEVFKITNRSTPTTTLEKALPQSENKEVSGHLKLLLTKCRFMEAVIVEMQDAMISMISDMMSDPSRCEKKSNNTGVFNLYQGYLPSHSQSRCGHNIRIQEIHQTKNCFFCKEYYKEKFLSPIRTCENAHTFFDMLEKGDDVATAVKKLAPPGKSRGKARIIRTARK